MTTETVPADASAEPPRRRLYARLWRGVPRELGFLLPLLPIVIVGLAVSSSVFFTGIGLVTVLVGVLIVLAALYVARGFGMFELLRLRGTGLPPIAAPTWDRVAPRAGWFGKLVAPTIDGHYWLHLLHTMVVNPIVGTVTWAIAVAWTATALGGVTYWFWNLFIPTGDRDFRLFDVVWGWATGGQGVPVDGRLGDSLLLLAVGLIFLVTLPFVTHGLTVVHHGIARGMLGAFQSEALQRQVTGLAAARGAAVAAEGTALRRLERDIHDGPQQRLVRLQMDLAAADRQLDTDPAAARALIDEAMQHSKDALDELRALSRGFAPPILLDRGLVAALESLAVRAPSLTTVTTDLPDGLEFPPELERNAYFIAAEGLTNAAKHAQATVTDVNVRYRAADGTQRAALDIVITDDGRGGAEATPGHGLAGLDERVRGLGGTLEVRSPIGGPTSVAAHLPWEA